MQRDLSKEILQFCSFCDYLKRFNLYSELLTYRENNEKLTILLRSHILFAISIRPKVSYIEFSDSRAKFFEQNNISIRYTKTGPRIYFSNQFDLFNVFPALRDLYMDSFRYISNDRISCCSRYQECSDAGECVIQDSDSLFVSTKYSCVYRQNLLSGKNYFKRG